MEQQERWGQRLAGCAPRVQAAIRGVWAAAVVWAALLLCMEAALTGRAPTAPTWLAQSASSAPASAWLPWVAVGMVCWLVVEYLASVDQAAHQQQRGAVDTGGACKGRWRSGAGAGDAADGSGGASGSGGAGPPAVTSGGSGSSARRRSLERRLQQLSAASAASARGRGRAAAGPRPPAAPAADAGGLAPLAQDGGSPSLARRLRRLSLRVPAEAFSEAPAHQGAAMVLYVDASPIDQAVMGVLLGHEPGFRLECAASGRAALEAVLTSPWLPDVVVLDGALPDMRPLEVCARLRAILSPVELPVMLVESRSGEADMLAALEGGGVNDFLLKPLRRAELLARLNSQLAVKHSVRREAQSRSHYELLSQVLPPHIIQRLAAGQPYTPESHDEVTILFSDIVGFTELCSSWPTTAVVALLDLLFSLFDDLSDKHDVFKVETVGDAYMVVAGHDGAPDHARRMAAMAVDMLSACEDVQHLLMAAGKDGRRVQIRVGMHTGPVLSGVVGKRRPRFCFFGDSCNVASRMESTGYPMAVHMSDACARGMAAAAKQRRPEEGGEAAPLPWEVLDLGERHIKGKGRMRTHLLKAGEWRAALSTHRAQLLHCSLEGPQHGSSTCSTSSPLSAPSPQSAETEAAHSLFSLAREPPALGGRPSWPADDGLEACTPVLTPSGGLPGLPWPSRLARSAADSSLPLLAA